MILIYTPVFANKNLKLQTLTHKDFTSELSRRLGYTLKDASDLTASLTGRIIQELQEGGTVSVQDFGNFEMKKKQERIIINPATKQRMLVPPKLTAVFKPCSRLKNIIK